MCCNQAYLLLWKNTASMQSLLCGIFSVPALGALGFLGSVWHSNMLSGIKAKDHANFSWKTCGVFQPIATSRGVGCNKFALFPFKAKGSKKRITESTRFRVQPFPPPSESLLAVLLICRLATSLSGGETGLPDRYSHLCMPWLHRAKCGFPCAQVKGYEPEQHRAMSRQDMPC